MTITLQLQDHKLFHRKNLNLFQPVTLTQDQVAKLVLKQHLQEVYHSLKT